MTWRRGVASILALALAACAPAVATLPPGPVAAGPAIAIAATPVSLNPQDPAQDRIGEFVYAGGAALSSGDTARFHGLSELDLLPNGEIVAITDEGDLLRARLVHDRQGRLTGLSNARLSALAGPDGKPLPDKASSDAEGLAALPGGDLLVSFERDHRILLYPADGSAPRLVPAPAGPFPPNGGMEALFADPTAGRDAYVTAGEDSGETWTCRLSAACTPGPTLAKPKEFGVVAGRKLPDGRTAWLLRAWDPIRGSRIALIVRDGERETARLELARPLTVDNFEGLAVAPQPDGALRFYLLSDDNFQASQRTLLLAFDWTPRD